MERKPKSTPIGLASRANQTSEGDATKQTGLATSPFPVPDSKSQDTGNGNSTERKPSESLHSTSVNQQSPTLWGRPPPVPQRATQPIYDAEAKSLRASTSIPGVKSYAAVSPENRYQRSGTPIPDSTSPAVIGSENQDQRSSASMAGSASAAATGSPYDPQIFVKRPGTGVCPAESGIHRQKMERLMIFAVYICQLRKLESSVMPWDCQRIILRTKSVQV